MLCPKCKGELPSNATVCTICGAMIMTEQQPTEGTTKQVTARLEYSTSAMEVIVPDEKKNGKNKKKGIAIISGALAAVIIIVSALIVLTIRHNNNKGKVGNTVSYNQESVSSEGDQTVSPVVTFIKWDSEDYYRKFVIYREGEEIISIDHSIGTNASKHLNGELFTQGQLDAWVKYYTGLFDRKNLDERYITTEVYSNSDEVRATIKVLDLRSIEAQKYFKEQQIIDFYKLGMTYTELSAGLIRNGYKFK